jgi:hypothetical protein
VSIQIYKTTGELVPTLVEEILLPGSGEVAWDGINNSGWRVASGVYVYRLRVGKATLSRKMTLLK